VVALSSRRAGTTRTTDYPATQYRGPRKTSRVIGPIRGPRVGALSSRHAGTTQYRGPRKNSHVIGPRVVAAPPSRHADTTRQYRGPRKTSHVIGPRVAALSSRHAGTTQHRGPGKTTRRKPPVRATPPSWVLGHPPCHLPCLNQPRALHMSCTLRILRLLCLCVSAPPLCVSASLRLCVQLLP
jgi:hypothetical protein